MLALILESPERLWWSFVLLVPLLIHLLRRRRYHQHGWAAMEFVVRAMQEKSQKGTAPKTRPDDRACVHPCFVFAGR